MSNHFTDVFSHFSNGLLSVIYPQTCSLCSRLVNDRSDGVVCNDCWKSAKIFTGLETACVKCGAFLSDAEPLFDTYCGQCDDHFYDLARAVGAYRGPLTASVLYLKKIPGLPPKLGSLLERTYLDCFEGKADVIIPVPLSRKRFKERGFNQAAVIARDLSKRTGVMTDEHSLARTVHTPMHRAGMDIKAREMSVKNAFAVTRPKLVKERNVLLVDDILTSGATASYCAKALKESGAATVNVLTISRAV